MQYWLQLIYPYLLLTVAFLYLVYLAGRKTCAECPHPEKWLCFGTCKEVSEKMQDAEKTS